MATAATIPSPDPLPRNGPRSGTVGPVRGRSAARHWLGGGLIALAAALVANSLLGPLAASIVDYPLSETLLNQTIGLEAFSLVVIAPVSMLAGVLVLRGERWAQVLALGPAAYTAYMFLQYVIGPEYSRYPAVMPLHLALFAAGGAILLTAWAALDPDDLPPMPARTVRGWAVALLVMTAFLLSRYLESFSGMASGAAIPSDSAADVSMFWTILLLDLGVVLPLAVAASVGLLRGARWAGKALYGVVGWYALAPPSVAAMSLAMTVNGDPHASTGQTMVFVIVSMVYLAVAARLYGPLLGGRARA